jgi:hypothetical protein
MSFIYRLTILMLKIVTAIILIIYLIICSKEYYTLEKISINPTIPNYRIVLSFTSIPSRIKYIPDVLTRLKDQTFNVDCVYICIPYYSKRFKKVYDISSLSQFKFGENVKIVRCEDFGPATKLLGCIPYENDPNTLIITIDDDQKYASSMINTLVAYADYYPNYAIGFHGIEKDAVTYTINIKNKDILSPLAYYLEGFGGVAYRRKFISKEMINYFNNHLTPECLFSDDLVVSKWLEIQGIKRLKICDEKNNSKTIKIVDDNDPLHKLKRIETYKKCAKNLEKLQNY